MEYQMDMKPCSLRILYSILDNYVSPLALTRETLPSPWDKIYESKSLLRFWA